MTNRIAGTGALLLLAAARLLDGHDAHGRSIAPPEARRLKNPLAVSDSALAAGQLHYAALCAGCHGADGRARTKTAGALPVRPTDLTHFLMESMKEGEIYWVIANGSGSRMPAFGERLTETGRWQTTLYVRELRSRQRSAEKAALGPYEWQLPPGFPYPNVPADNPMTKEKVELGRWLFHDRRLSLNRTQSCATCHVQARAFADARGRGLGSTGELHPRGPMSLANVAYAPVLTWANPNVRQLEQQALVPVFGDHPVELGMTGREGLLLQRLKAVNLYKRLFPAAFPASGDPFTLDNVMKAIASFERTILSGNSPYDEYRRGDDPNAISEAAKRGEALFFSERLECFHCHGGFNFTGTIDYLGKGFAEVEFHNTGLYNVKGRVSYPEPNVGLYEFTQAAEDVGKFKAPTLRNIALTAPYMHDGSISTLEGVIDHYRAGGRSIRSGPRAGIGFDNPNKSEFVKSFELNTQEKADLLSFLHSLTDRTLLTDPLLSDPFRPSVSRRSAPLQPPKFTLQGEVVRVYPEDGAVSLHHEAVPGLMDAMLAPKAMEFLVADKQALAGLTPGSRIKAGVYKRGNDYFLVGIQRRQDKP